MGLLLTLAPSPSSLHFFSPNNVAVKPGLVADARTALGGQILCSWLLPYFCLLLFSSFLLFLLAPTKSRKNMKQNFSDFCLLFCSPFIMECLKEFYLTYDDTQLRWNGADLLSRVAKRFLNNKNISIKRPELNVQPSFVFFPISSQHITRYWYIAISWKWCLQCMCLIKFTIQMHLPEYACMHK